MTDPYQESLAYLYGRLNYERLGMPRASELRVGRMRRLLRALGDPQGGLRIVHIAGTKGKGSTSAMIAAALSAAGYRTGLFCSPHLHDLGERFSVDGLPASPEELVRLVELVRPVIARIDAVSESIGQRALTFFEVTTAMGLLHFHLRGAQAVVLEVGLGGRLDSTNAIRPVVSVVTNISFDHTRQLGNTLAAIAREKAGIFKRGRPALSAETQPEPAEVIRAVARQRRAPLRELGRDFTYQYTPPSQPLDRPRGGTVEVTTWKGRHAPLEVPLLGEHQAANAALALATLDLLDEHELGVTEEAVATGFARLHWPARVEVMGERPWLVVDGAHNVASAEALAQTLRTHFPAVPRTLVFGTTRDKDLRGQLRVLLPLCGNVVAARYVENPRAVPPEEVAEAVRELSGQVAVVTSNPASALEAARRITVPAGLICVTGSLFLATETRDVILGRRTNTTAHRSVAAP